MKTRPRATPGRGTELAANFARRAAAVRVRAPATDDAMTIGMLVHGALFDAPSAPLDADELGDDLEQIGRDFISAVSFGNESLLLAEIGRHAAGIVRLVPREFARGSHVATMQILVAPALRGRGVGRVLRDAGLAEGFSQRGFERIEMAVASHDLGLERLVGAEHGRTWTLERVERRALRIDGRWRDFAIWVTEES
jgi:GNAT superfamily N-acetyltransferase